jgi:hypothetical protein
MEKNMPTQPSNILSVPFFGDFRSAFDLSSCFLKSYKQKFPDKYIIICSWPGLQGLFPYVDEFWTIEDESVIKSLALEANNIYNTSSLSAEITRGLAEVIEVMTPRDICEYYYNGFTQKYWQTFGEIKRFLPEVLSASKISADFKNQMARMNGKKVIVYPATKLMSWQQGKTVHLPVGKDFWNALIQRMLDDGYCPVVYQNWFTYDMSKDFTDKCAYLVAKNITDVLAAIRYIGCVLDVHSGISRLALAARSAHLTVTERRIFVEDKHCEIEELCGLGMPKEKIYSFSTMLMTGGPDEWKISLIDNIMTKLNLLLNKLDINNLPKTNEIYETVSYDAVKKKKANRMGLSFLNLSKKR